MPKGQPTDLKLKKEIMQKLAAGQSAAALAKEYGFSPSQIHNWVYYAKKKRREQSKKSRLKNNAKPDKEGGLEELVQKFKEDVKQLIIKEMLENMAAFESAI